MAKNKKSVPAAVDDDYKPIPSLNLVGEDVFDGVELDDEITLTVKARLIDAQSRDYEGKPRKEQRYQLNSIKKADSKSKKGMMFSNLQKSGRSTTE